MKKALNIFQIIASITSFFLVFFFTKVYAQILIASIFLTLSLLSHKRGEIFKMLSNLSILLIFTLIVHLFFRFGESQYWQAFTSMALWEKSIYFTLRNGNILLIMSYLIKSGININIADLTNNLESHKPSKIFQPLSLALRYSTLISEEFKSIQQVHRIMGIQRPKHFIAQAKYYTSLIVPTIISSLERAEHLSIAMTSRGYNQE